MEFLGCLLFVKKNFFVKKNLFIWVRNMNQVLCEIRGGTICCPYLIPSPLLQVMMHDYHRRNSCL